MKLDIYLSQLPKQTNMQKLKLDLKLKCKASKYETSRRNHKRNALWQMNLEKTGKNSTVFEKTLKAQAANVKISNKTTSNHIELLHSEGNNE